MIDMTPTTFSTFIDSYIKGQKAVRNSLMVKQMGAIANVTYYDYLASEIDVVSNIIERCEAAALAVRCPVSV